MARKRIKKSLSEQEKLTFLSALYEAAISKKAENVLIFDVRDIVSYTNHIMICTGNSDRQVCAIADEIQKEALKFNERPLSVEGYERGYWVILDFVDTVIHILQREPREYYNLEGILIDARRVEPVLKTVKKRKM